MNKILVPVDFSDTSKNALLYATKLFGKAPLEITVLHIYGTTSTALLMKSIDSILIEDAQRNLKLLLDEVKKEAPNVSFKTKLSKNYAVSTITSLGDSGTYNFIVMGTKGASGLKEVFIGSVAGGVISKTKAPVIVVPSDYNYNEIKEIVFAISNHPVSDKKVIDPLLNIRDMHTSNLEVLHISKEESTNIKNVLSNIGNLNATIKHKSGSGNLNEHLNDYIKDNNTDLLCLLRGEKDFIDRLLKDSVTLKQTFNSAVPLLILHS